MFVVLYWFLHQMFLLRFENLSCPKKWHLMYIRLWWYSYYGPDFRYLNCKNCKHGMESWWMGFTIQLKKYILISAKRIVLVGLIINTELCMRNRQNYQPMEPCSYTEVCNCTIHCIYSLFCACFNCKHILSKKSFYI